MRSFLIIFLYCNTMLYSALAFANKIEIVTLQYPPYQYDNNGELKGVALEIIEEVFHQMHQPINITILPWARAMKYIRNGKADAIFTIFKTKEREIFADFSNEILIDQTVSLFVRSESNIIFSGNINELNQYRIATVRGVSYGKIYDLAMKNEKFKKLTNVNTGSQTFEMLINDRVDIVVSNRYGALYILENLSIKNIKELSPELQKIPSYIAFSKRSNLSKTKKKFDKILKQMKIDGTYQRIINSYFSPELEEL